MLSLSTPPTSDPLASALYGQFDGILSRTDPEDSYESWLKQDPLFLWGDMNRTIVRALDRVERGEIKRLLVTIPSRYGKSEPISRRFAAYALRRNPKRWIGLASYGANLAEVLSQDARRYYVGSGQDLTQSKKDHWQTEAGGGMWAAGVRGTIVGKGFDIGIIDDPHKDAEDAISLRKQEELKNFWQGTWITRQQPGGHAAIIVVMQRFAVDDFVGFLYEREEEDPQNWHVLAFDAIHEDKPYGIPSTCTIEPDWREEGETLWPEMEARSSGLEGAELIEAARKEVQRRISAAGEWGDAIYQSRPKDDASEGKVCPQWGDHLVSKVERQPNSRLIVGMDFNIDPMSAAVGQIVEGKRLEWLKEYQLYGADVQDLARAVRADFPKLRDCYPDATGAARAHVGGSVFGILRKFGFHIHAGKSNPAPAARRAAFNNLCRNGRVTVDRSCSTMRKAYRKLRFRPGSNEVDTTTGLDHIYDATTYPVAALFPIQAPRKTKVRARLG